MGLGCSLVFACGSSGAGGAAIDPASPEGVSRSVDPQPPAPAPTRVIDGTSSPTISEGPAAATDAGARPDAPCAGRRTTAGDFERNVMLDGRSRHYRVFVPPNDGTAPMPVVLSFHGATEDGAANRATTGYDTLGATKRFITVYLDGYARTWNAGGCCDPAKASNIDDVHFVTDTLATLTRELCVDERRVYASGFSNGGFMSYRLACELGDRIAAIGVAGATLQTPTCVPPRAVPIMHVHGTFDPVVPISGNPALGFPSVEDTIVGWVARDRCTSGPHDGFHAANGTCRVWDHCADNATIQYCRLDGTFHAWPNGASDFPTTAAMWDFLSAHSL